MATDIEPDSESSTLRCRRFSIINGAQTVRSLSKAHGKPSNRLHDVRVLLRVMDFSLTKDADFLTDATRYNNTQNAIKVSDFRSNDPVQKDLHRRFSNLNRQGRPFVYKNKRSREPVGSKIPIGMEELAKSVYSFRYGPDDMFGGTKHLFDTSKTGGYSKVFGEPVSQLDDDQFRLLAGTYFVCDEIHNLWKEKREKDRSEGIAASGLERRWIVYYAVGQLLRLVYASKGADLDADLRRLSKPNKWMDNPKSEAKAGIAESFKLVSVAVSKAYGLAAKDPEFRHRNWFRNINTLSDINAELEIIPQYRASKDLPMLSAADDE